MPILHEFYIKKEHIIPERLVQGMHEKEIYMIQQSQFKISIQIMGVTFQGNKASTRKEALKPHHTII